MMLATLASSAAETPADAQPKITPEMPAKLADLRTRIQSSVGQVVLAMANLPRYRNQTLADLSHLVLEPLLRDRLANATARPKDEGEAESKSVRVSLVSPFGQALMMRSMPKSVNRSRATHFLCAYPVRTGCRVRSSGCSM